MEVQEPVAPPGADHQSDKCPFCPLPKDEDFTTHPGAKALGTTLAAIMEDPSSLVSKQSAARPKDGAAERQPTAETRSRPNPPLEHPVYGAYSYEAHHLIPGKQDLLKSEGASQVMNGHPIEDWIKKSGKIKKDTGYSINNSDNGVWLASAPSSVKKTRGFKPATPWEREDHPNPNPNALTTAQKNEIADYAMTHGAGQFHYGKHAINDDEGSAPSYPKVVHERLTNLADNMLAWSKVCPLCAEKPSDPPYDPSWKVNGYLDAIAMQIRVEIQAMPASTWKYFISSHAMRLGKAMNKKIQSL